MKKRFLSTLLCLTMLFGTFPIGVSAEESNAPETEPPAIAVQANVEYAAKVATDGTTTKYGDIAEAFAAAQEAADARLTLLADVQANSILSFTKGDVKGSKVKVTYELNKPYKSMGSVIVVGKELNFDKSEWFIAVAKLASNINV